MSIHQETRRLFLTAEEKIQLLNLSACDRLTPGQTMTVMIKYILSLLQKADIKSIYEWDHEPAESDAYNGITFLSWLGYHDKVDEFERNFSDMRDQLQKASGKPYVTRYDKNRTLSAAQLLVYTCPQTMDEWDENRHGLFTEYKIKDFDRLKRSYMAISNLYMKYQSEVAEPYPYEDAMADAIGWLIAVYDGS